MKKNLADRPALFPMPVLMVATYDESNTVNVMNAAWGMISDMDKITLFLDEGHKTTANIRAMRAFTVSLADQAHMAEADFFGIATGNKMPDKFARTGLHATKSAHVNAPIIEEFPVVMECALLEIIETEHTFAIVGQIMNAQAEESVLDAKGNVEPSKLNALMFNQFQKAYYSIGVQIGKAWNAGAYLMKKSERSL